MTASAAIRQQWVEGLPAFSLDKEFVPSETPILSPYAELFGFADLPVPCRWHFGYLQLLNYRIATHYWRLENSRATVFVTHGLFDHVGLFLPLVRHLLKNNFSVIAFDLPEHGLSSGEYGEIKNFAVYSQVFDELLSFFHDKIPEPWYAVGQSTGGAVIMRHLLSNESALQRVALLAPLVRPKGMLAIEIKKFFLSPFLRSVKRDFGASSHDQDFLEFVRNKDPLQPRIISVNWVAAMLSWAKEINTFASKNTELLVVQGDADETVDFVRNPALIKRAFPRMELFRIEGARHHIVGESEQYRMPAFDAVVEFLNR